MLSLNLKRNISRKLGSIYKGIISNEELKIYSKEIFNVIENSNKIFNKKKIYKISEKTSVLISYGDSLLGKGKQKNLKIFKKFYQKKLSSYFDTLHFLPFYPSSSDSGFAVKDHYKVDSKLGSWSDIKKISQKSIIMADIVINHASSKGLWFKNFLRNKSPGKNYFTIVDKTFNTSKVVRPREHKLLKKITIFNKNDYLWRTFSNDQIDLDFKNPKVLIRFIKVMLNLSNNGISIFRLDAIAYLWKKSGTKCINLRQTHEIVQLLRLVCDSLNFPSTLVTETNLPEKENLSYFGKNNNESNWIYNFTLPPLLIHALLFEDSSNLFKWSEKLPQTKKGNNYLNFIASHDGIGMRPMEGFLNKNKTNKFFKRLKKNGAQFSFRKIQGSSKKVYEANITLFDAFKKTDFDKSGKFYFERYICAHAIMIAFEGIPAIYFNSIFGTANDEYKFIISGNKRDLNRYKWNESNLQKFLKNRSSKQSIYYKKIVNLIDVKNKQKAFHPNAKRINLKLGKNLFGFIRISLDNKQKIICLNNLSSKIQFFSLNKKYFKYKNILSHKNNFLNNQIKLSPFETVWLSNL